MKLMYGLNSIDFNSPRLIQPLHCCMPQTVNTRDQAHLISVVQFFLEPKQPLNDKLTGTFYTVRGMDSSQGGLTRFTVAFSFLPSGPWPAQQELTQSIWHTDTGSLTVSPQTKKTQKWPTGHVIYSEASQTATTHRLPD